MAGLDDLLSTARQKLPLLNQTTSLSPFTTAPAQPVSASQSAPALPPPPNPIPVIPPATGQQEPQGAPLDALRQDTQNQMAGLSVAPSSQMPTDRGIPLMELALGPILNRGQGGTGNPQNDINRAIDLTAHGISNGAGTIPSGGPTSSIDYASLPGMYGRLVDPPGGPSDLRLQAGAVASLKGVLPLGAILGGSYRTYAQQAANYARDPNHFAPPGKSLHEYGLAIDVNTSYLSDHPDARQALLNAGWYQERSDEPWHFSFQVFNPGTVPQATPQGPGRSAGGPSATSPRSPSAPPRQRIRRGSHQQR